jgi:hypothetical protein
MNGDEWNPIMEDCRTVSTLFDFFGLRLPPAPDLFSEPPLLPPAPAPLPLVRA